MRRPPTATGESNKTYDAMGNNTNSGSWSYNALNELTAGSAAYDANGNMTTDPDGHKYFYDAWNHLIAVTDASGNLIEGFSYDGLGRRVEETQRLDDLTT